MLSVRLSGYEDGAPCTRTLAAPAPDARWALHAADAVAVTLPGLKRDLLLQQLPRGAAGASLGVGGVLWEAALVLAAAVDALAPTGRLAGALFVELGAGAAGLPSLAAAAAGAAAVATDRGGVVGALEASAALNGLASASPRPTPGRVTVATLDWADPGAAPALAAALPRAPAVVAAADCVYTDPGGDSPSAEALIAAAASLSGPGTRCWFAVDHRSDMALAAFDAALRARFRGVARRPPPPGWPAPGVLLWEAALEALPRRCAKRRALGVAVGGE